MLCVRCSIKHFISLSSVISQQPSWNELLLLQFSIWEIWGLERLNNSSCDHRGTGLILSKSRLWVARVFLKQQDSLNCIYPDISAKTDSKLGVLRNALKLWIFTGSQASNSKFWTSARYKSPWPSPSPQLWFDPEQLGPNLG